MAYKLVIVESPAKGRTIERYLGSDYRVLASFGHVRDLPKGSMGVDTEKDYAPTYITPPKAKKVISILKKAANEADHVFLATDPDREGEAIAWHVAQSIGLSDAKKNKKKGYGRIAFHSITKEEVQSAIGKPREIDINLVNAQQARRVIDRLVGYSLSPILWKKIYKGLSAGRVQSVAVRLVVERERERDAFKAEEYWTIEADLKKGTSAPFSANLTKVNGKAIEKLSIKSEQEARVIVEDLKHATYTVIDVSTKESKRQPYAPFTTSTLQQEASSKLGWSARQTMQVAQRLYEAGKITYMRTDSTTIAPVTVAAIRKYIASAIGENYLASSARIYKTKTKKAQEAHEAIRPTYPKNRPDSCGISDAREQKLYGLIWRRTIASQMADAKYLNTTAQIKASEKYIFSASGIKVLFAGWRKIYTNSIDGEKLLPELHIKDVLDLVKLRHEQHFTQPPARYSEATLIKALEERGIGRPSTYAPTMTTILDRGYVVRETGRLKPEKVGFLVNDLLCENFPEIVDYDFTAKIENELDDVAVGNIGWTKVVADTFLPLEKQIATKADKIERVNSEEETDEKCPQCKKPIVIKRGKYGKFYACTGFPECRYTRPFLTESQQKLKDKAESYAQAKKCPKCQSPLVARQGKFGWFVGCSNYPKCKFIENIKGRVGTKAK